MERRLSKSHEALARRCGKVDFKREWRVKRAKLKLEARYGRRSLHRVALLFCLFLVMIVLVITLIVVYFDGSLDSLVKASETVNTIYILITGVATSVLAIPAFQLTYRSSMESSVSRGDVIFRQTKKRVKDRLGFSAEVRAELKIFFDYLREFGEDDRNNLELIIVPIVEDLDLCISEGRNLNVLEAIQMLLSVPEAPILSLLVVDSRIVVASIENDLSGVTENANINGFEFLDRIVQLPFCIPEPSPQKVERMLRKQLEAHAAKPTAEEVVKRLQKLLKDFMLRRTAVMSLPIAMNMKLSFEFRWKQQVVDLEPLLETLTKSFPSDTERVIEAGLNLGGEAKELAQHQRKFQDVETLELLCREINAALEKGKIFVRCWKQHIRQSEVYKPPTKQQESNILRLFTPHADTTDHKVCFKLPARGARHPD